MKRRALVLIPVLVLAMGAAIFIWRVEHTRAKAARIESEILKGLTAEEIKLVLKSQAASDVSSVVAITQTAQTRHGFLSAMREHLALAAEARREGLSEDANYKINLEYKKNLLLADLYLAKLRSEQPNYVIPQAGLDAVWTSAENEKHFNKDMAALRQIQAAVARERGDQYQVGQLQGESLIRARDNWARAKVLSNKARTDRDFMSRPEVELRFRILEAGILAADYLRAHWATRIKATPQDITAYLAAHPEYDLKRKLEKARAVLQRARAGEDFDRLAREFSEDRSTRDKGGLYENVEKGTIWEEVESAALALNDGQVANSLVETHTGYHIVKLEKKIVKKESNGAETVIFNLRHILLQKSFEEPGNRNPEIPPPFVSPEEIARTEVEKSKRNHFVDEIVQRNRIILPEDFDIDLPATFTEGK